MGQPWEMDMPRQQSELDAQREQNGAVEAVRRAVEIMQLVANRDDLTSMRAVAAAAGFPKSSVARILETLVETGMLQNGNGAYSLGTRLRRLGIRALDGMDVRAAARTAMEDLAHRTGETVSLNVRFGEVRMYVEQVESQHMLRAKGEIGRPYPLLVGAPGRALIYPLPDDEIEALLDRAELQSYTENTPVTRDGVWAAIREARQRDAAMARDEVISGLATVAVPIMDLQGGVIAALGVTGPSSRVDHEQLVALLPVVRESVKELCLSLGSAAAALRPALGGYDNTESSQR